MKSKFLLPLFLFLLTVNLPDTFAEELGLFTNSKVYSPNQPLFIYVNGLPNENLIIRLFAPDGSISKFEQITTSDDGTYTMVLLVWPEPSTSFPFGTYTIEVISTEQNGLSRTLDVKFTSTADLIDVPVERHVNTLVFAPETAAVNTTFRVFVQTTSDGLLIGNDPKQLLETTHVHLPSGKVESLTDSFNTLHQGLYFVDYTPKQEGTYVFHVVAFNQGTISHGSVATNVISQDISGISKQIIELNSILNETSSELDELRSEVNEFGSTLNTASESIDSSVSSVATSVFNIGEASNQLNSLLFPIVASIGLIVALQITILARRR